MCRVNAVLDTGTVTFPVKIPIYQVQKMRSKLSIFSQTTTNLQRKLNFVAVKVTASLARFVANRSIITQDQWVLQAIQGYILHRPHKLPYNIYMYM